MSWTENQEWGGIDIKEIVDNAVAKERTRFMQLVTDPENQPTQYGTVTWEYMEQEIAKEREVCAKLCERIISNLSKSEGFLEGYTSGGKDCASAIRSRGEVK